MLGASITRHVRGAASRFVAANQGNIAVIFAIALVPIISFVGAAIDYSRVNNARSSMQSALDSTALMLSKDLSTGTITAAQVDAKAQSYFGALYTNADAKSVTVSATYTADNGNLGSTIQVNGSASVPTDFMKVAGFPNIGFNTSSTSAWGNVRMRVAMALDNTGSMAQNGKIAALRTAASNMVDQLSALAKNPGDVYISVVPFAKVVNVGSSNSGATWIDWTDWLNPPTQQPNNGSAQATLPMNWHAVAPGVKCPFTNSAGGFTCTSGPGSTSNAATIPSSGTYSGYICPSVDYNSHTLYNGCWDSEPSAANTLGQKETFCSGNSSCSCPTTSSGSVVGGCSCTGNGGGKSCTGFTYVHNWTQPGLLDLIHNLTQPRVTAFVGFANDQWTASKPTPSVPNNWIQASTNPISTWTGCVTDRTQPYDAQNDTPNTGNTATLFPANQYYENGQPYCNSNNSPPLQQIMPLSYDWSTLKATINAMQPTGGTDQAIGMAWAWESLLQTAPMNAPAEDPNYTYNRVIILLSDGLNTEDRWPANGDGSTQFNGSIDIRQELLCKNIKAAVDPKTNLPMYTIYTIQVNTSSPSDPTSTVLQDCASDPSKFFMLTSANQIVTTFNSIGTSLSQLRVAR